MAGTCITFFICKESNISNQELGIMFFCEWTIPRWSLDIRPSLADYFAFHTIQKITKIRSQGGQISYKRWLRIDLSLIRLLRKIIIWKKRYCWCSGYIISIEKEIYMDYIFHNQFMSLLLEPNWHNKII